MIKLNAVKYLFMEYNNDPVVREMLNTIEILYKENAELKEKLELETEMNDDGYYGGIDSWGNECGSDSEVGC